MHNTKTYNQVVEKWGLHNNDHRHLTLIFNTDVEISNHFIKQGVLSCRLVLIDCASTGLEFHMLSTACI